MTDLAGWVDEWDLVLDNGNLAEQSRVVYLRSVRQFLTILGLAPTLRDSVVQTWTEPRRSDAPFAVDGGVTYALRSVALDISALPAGRYSLAVSMTKRLSGASATTTRTFVVER